MSALHKNKTHGFTLIELSIVLAIVGLVAGGVLIGKDLIAAAALRSQITQLEQYRVSLNTFRIKYGNHLPGDIAEPAASMFGFQPRGNTRGTGDGNGILERGVTCGHYKQGSGETGVFWADLSDAKLISGDFSTMTTAEEPDNFITHSGDELNAYYPRAKIGGGNFIYVWSGGSNKTVNPCNGPSDNTNYFGISSIMTMVNGLIYPGSGGSAGLTVHQAYSLDQKLDDGLPNAGAITTMTSGDGQVNFAKKPLGPWFYGASIMTATGYLPTVAATVGTADTCYDNSTSSDGQTAAQGNAMHYSTQMNGGSGNNCALSFRF